MAIPEYPLSWQQGDDAEVFFYYKEGDPPAAVNLSTYQARMDISDATSKAIISLNSNDFSGPLDTPGNADNEITLGSDGRIYILIPRVLTINGILSSHVGENLTYDLFLRTPGGLQKKILKGNVMIERSNTLWL